MGIADDHLVHHAEAVDQDTKLPACLSGQLSQTPGELRAYKAISGHAALIKRLQGLILAWL